MNLTCDFSLCGKSGKMVVRRFKGRLPKIGKAASLSIDPTKSTPLFLTVFASKDMDKYYIKSNLLHELFEGAMLLNGMRFENSNPNYYGNFFMFEHGQMADVIDNVYKTFDEIINKLEI